MKGNKLRAVSLAALMVLSAFVGTIAFAGGAAATTNATLSSTGNSITLSQGATGTAQTITLADSAGANGNQIAVDNVSIAKQSGALTADDIAKIELVHQASGSTTVVSSNSSITSLDAIEFDGFSSGGDSSSNTDVGEFGDSDNELVLNDGATEALEVQVTLTSGASASGDSITFQSDVTLVPESAANGPYEVFAGPSNTATTSNAGTVTLDASGPSPTGAVSYIYESSMPYSVTDSAAVGPTAAGNTHVEVVFDEGVSSATTASDYVVTLENDTVVDPSNYKVFDPTTGDQHVVIDLGNRVGSVEVDTVNVASSNSIQDSNSNNAQPNEVNAKTTSTTLVEGQATSSSSPETTYEGERVAIASDELNENLQIESVDNDDYFFSGSTGDGSYVYTFNTANKNISTDYSFTFQGASGSSDTVTTSYLDIRSFELNISVDDRTVYQGSMVEGTVTSNLGGRTIDLGYTSYDNIDNQTLTLNGSGGASFSIAAPDKNDNFTLTATDEATGTSVESVPIEVSETPDGDVSFTQSVYTEQQGDLVNVTVQLNNAQQDAASITVGSFSANYIANFTVVDEDEDGEVTFQMNTFNASADAYEDNNGAMDSPVHNGAGMDAYQIIGDNDDDDRDTITGLSENGSAIAANDNILTARSYSLEAAQGIANYNEDDPDSADGVAAISVRERNLNNFAVNNWRAPENIDTVPSTVGEVLNGVGTNITQTDTIAKQDLLVLQVEASGMTGIIKAQSGANQTEKFLNVFQKSDRVDLANLTVTGPDDKQLKLSGSSVVSTVVDGENDTHYVVLDTEATVYVDENEDEVVQTGEKTNFRGNSYEAEAGETYTSNVTVLANEDITGFSQMASVTDDVMLENRDASIVVEGDQLTFPVSENATLNATTTIAPGSEVSLRIESQDQNNPFLESNPDARVMLVDGQAMASANFDLSGQPVGTNVTASVSGGNFEDGTVSMNGVLVEATQPDNGTTTTTTPDDTTTTTSSGDTTTTTSGDTTTTTSGGDTTTSDGGNGGNTTTSSSGPVPGFGIGIALIALLAAGALALRREN